jgi:hypothetical protein
MKISKITLFLPLYLIMASCGTSKDAIIYESKPPIDNSKDVIPYGNNEKGNSVYESEINGNDSDEHGCRPSAGYTWSIIKKECLRVFELNMKLYNAGKTQMTCAIFSTDKNQVEIFTPQGSLILDKETETIYKTTLKENQKFFRIVNNKWQFGTVSTNKIEFQEI